MYNFYRQRTCPPGTFPYVIKPGDNFYRLSIRFNTTVPALISANPTVNPSNLRIGQRICVPRQRIYPACPEGNYYSVKPGDTLYKIARDYNISLDDLIEANPGITPYMLMVGQVICIPLATPPVTCPEGNAYTIKPGDTFYKVARRFNVSLDALIEANPTIDPDRLLVGQRICIPLTTPPVRCPENSIEYSIKSGDTLGKLAIRFNTTVAALRELNPEVEPENLRIGQKICIPQEAPALPETKEIPVFVEGETEYREASLQRSPQEYYIYVLDNFEFTPEEPGRDVLFSNYDDEFFVRIERLEADTELSNVRENAVLELRDIGDVRQLEGEEILDPFFRENIFFLNAFNEEISKNIIVKEFNGIPFKFTMFLPNREAAEGIIPSFYAMLKTIGIL